MADLLAFPVHRRVGKIRDTARSIDGSRTAREATARWSRARDSVERSLVKAGLSDVDKATALRMFVAAVDIELLTMRSDWRLNPSEFDTAPGGAA